MKIRFRVWDVKEKKMYYPNNEYSVQYYIESDGDLLVVDNNDRSHVYGSEHIVMQEVQAYNLKLYIGDIVDITVDGYLDIGSFSFDTYGPEVYRGKIIYNNYSFGILFDQGFMYLSTIEADEIIDIVVVGNVWQDEFQGSK